MSISYMIPFYNQLTHTRVNNKLENNNQRYKKIIINHLKFNSNRNYDIYEFGTYMGTTLKNIINILKNNNIIINNINGFDSLRGLTF